MSGRKLAGSVYLTDPDGHPIVLTPDTTIPDWAVDQITNPAAWATDTPPDAESGNTTSAVEVASMLAAASKDNGDGDEGEGDSPATSEDETPAAPVSETTTPEPASNAAKAAWLAQAEHLGITVPDGATKADIQALVRAATTN